MNFEFFIAKKIFKQQGIKHKQGDLILKIATFAMAVSVAIMIISISVVIGFKKEISNKVIGFGSHITIVNYDSNTSFESFPISGNQNWLPNIKNIKGVVSVNKYITKAGIVKTENNLSGIVFKGVDKDFNWSFFEKNIIEGKIPEIKDSVRSNEILISKTIARNLDLKLGDNFKAYFVQEPPRMRNFTISGIYDTQLEELDKLFVILDIKQLRKLNDWNDDQISGFEIFIDDFSKITDYEKQINKFVGYNFNEDNTMLKVENIQNEYPGIFNWLALLDINVWVILILMIIVSAMNMISGILVIILERVKTIGILKSLGTKNSSIEKIFLYFGGFLILKGLFWGNVIGIGLCIIQYFFGLIKLNSASYYVEAVPIYFNIFYILILNVATLILITVIILLPVLIISKIKPSETIRFD
ncbi:MAG: ABC transporter permease [Bacteroidales bacterium]|jgi:lipoprotein-releasing system permease protein|nr:ABC transporter permease [Bacteroidales bacterium]